jgi:hypothetical protein
MPSSSPETSQELQYPPARVDQPFASVDLNTLMMRSIHHTQEENPLEESTYEVVGAPDSLYDTSDDEGHTASVASTTPDDVSNFDDDEDDDDFSQPYVDESTPEVRSSAAAATQNDYTLPSAHDSTLTELPGMAGSESSCSIQLEEESSSEHAHMEAHAVIKEFRKDQVTTAVLSRYNCSGLRLSVQATLSDRHLTAPASRPFNVLYVGKLGGSWVQTEIDSHVAAALNTSPGPSRSIMIRGQMETCGPDMLPWHCSKMEVLEEVGHRTGITVTLLHDASRLTVGAKDIRRNSDASRMPDLVVFWYPHSNTAAPEVGDYHVAAEAFGSHQVPCLHIAADRRFHVHQEGLNDKSLRVCVEGREHDQSDFKQKEKMPIDLFTFINLDPAQLNRHLAALSPRSFAASASAPGASARPGLLHNIKTKAVNFNKQVFDGDSPVSPNTKKLLSALAAFVLLMALYVGTVMMPQPYIKLQDPNGTSVFPSAASTTSGMSSSTLSAAPTSQPAVSLTPSPKAKGTSWDLSVLPIQPHPSQQKKAPKPSKAPEKVAGFEIETTGNYQFVLSPSKDFSSRKRKPQLQIQVHKDAKAIPIQYARTTDGAYVVDLEQKYSEALFNVSIATHTKPLMQQSFSIILGHKKSPLARFAEGIMSDVPISRETIRNLTSAWSDRIGVDLGAIMNDNSWWKRKVDNSKREVADQLREAKVETQRRLANRAEQLSKVPGETWLGLRKMTAPVRTSRASLQARNNSLRIRCAFEQTMGLSSKEEGGKKTHACKKMGW